MSEIEYNCLLLLADSEMRACTARSQAGLLAGTLPNVSVVFSVAVRAWAMKRRAGSGYAMRWLAGEMREMRSK